MSPEFAKAFELLEKLATQLGTTATFLWQTLVAQAQVYVTYWIIQAIIVFGFAGIYARSLFKTFQLTTYIDYGDKERVGTRWQKWDHNECGIGIRAIYILLGVPLLGMCLWMIVEISQVVTALVNPHYWALQKLLSLLSRRCG